MEEVESKRMQVKVLYSFNDNSTVFLSRSLGMTSVRVASIPGLNEDIMLGGYDLKSCIQQILQSSPENFQLTTHDYAVYYKDLTEQPDEPFVSNGVLSDLLKSTDGNLIPGRVCQNVSASFLFGNKKQNSLTLEIRLKFHTIEKYVTGESANSASASSSTIVKPDSNRNYNNNTNSNNFKRLNEYEDQQPKKYHKSPSVQPAKATRTKSLPVYNQPFNNMYNIRNADKMNTSSRYDPQSIQNRFKLAPFLDARVIDKPKVLRRRRNEPTRAVRTRSMINTRVISSPIHEEDCDDSDDTEYNDNNAKTVEGDDDDDEDEDENDTGIETSPYTPQQPPYKPNIDHHFESLPDLEDLDSKRTHMIHSNKIPENHGLVCVNQNCLTKSSITWRYFELDFQPHFLDIHKSEEFDKNNYEGMYGPMCNACYLFLRTKGFMRPSMVVKKYLQQQSYKKSKAKEDPKLFQAPLPPNSSIHNDNSSVQKKLNQIASSPMIGHKFVTPSHTPSAINQVIQNSKIGNQELNDFMNQLNNFGGPLTDIDLPEGVTPPMMATKSNTRLINLDEDNNKENCPPPDITQFNSSSSPAINGTEDFEKLIIKSFSKSSPLENGWMSLFNQPNNSNSSLNSNNSNIDYEVNNAEGPTPKDHVTPLGKVEEKKVHPSLPQMKTFSTRRSPRLNKIKNISSSPPLQSALDLLEKEIDDLGNSSPQPMATRNDTGHLVLSLYKNDVSSPSEIYESKNKT